jgi:transposase
VSWQSRYPSDLIDAEWALVEPLLPRVGSGGRPEKHPRREIVDAVLYVVRTGCAWRQLPAVADGVLVLRAVGEAAHHAAHA